MERVWAARLRWRIRGAWLAPLLVVLTVADALLIHVRPLAGDGRTHIVGALLLASFVNLVAIAALAPFAGMALRRLRPDLPAVVARDYAGAALIVLATAGLLAAGLSHHATVERNAHALGDAHTRAQAWIGTRAPERFRRHVTLADTVAIVPGNLYRTCVPDPRSGRAWCVVVRTDVPFPRGVRFAGGESNAVFQAGRG
jgi:hypothetical protein